MDAAGIIMQFSVRDSPMFFSASSRWKMLRFSVWSGQEEYPGAARIPESFALNRSFLEPESAFPYPQSKQQISR